MPSLDTLIFISGILHLGTLIGSAQVPKELDFKHELPKVSPMLQHWILVAGLYVVLNLVAFGLISLFLSDSLASGTPLARAFCGYVALFAAVRLIIQFTVFRFDAKPYLRNWFLTIGYHGLTFVFTWHTVVYGYAALFHRGH